MTLAVCADVGPADWIVEDDTPWPQLATFGPAGFAAHARVRYIPDPAYPDQRETDADADATPDEVEQWRTLLGLLASVTAAPDDCWFALWEGWPLPRPARRWPRFGIPRDGPKRAYYLFHGSLADASVWGGGFPARAGIWGPPDGEFSGGGEPAFVWPSDHSWCVAADIDPHWCVVGGSAALADRVIAEPGLDAVAADPAIPPPAYR